MAKIANVSNYHLQYTNLTSQHWNPGSERFAGGDHLLTAIYNGWEVKECVEAKHWYAGMRAITIYRFHLTRDGKEMTMPVVSNPYVSRFLREEKIPVKQEEDTKTA